MPVDPVGGPFALTDHFGNRVTDLTFNGKPALLYFGFTHCRVICPRALTRLSVALDSANLSDDDLQPLFITIDPDRDSPEVMRAFLDAHYPRFLGLTGDREQIDAMRAAYKVFARRIDDAHDPTGYAISHTAFSYLLDANGRYVTHSADTVDDGTLAQRLAEHCRRDAGGAGLSRPSTF